MIKALGILDIFAAIIIFLIPFKIPIPHSLVLFFAVYLLVKGVLFIKTPASWLDLWCFLVIVLTYDSLLPLPRTASFISAFILLQKGVFSLFA